jgi:hypothetical protein
MDELDSLLDNSNSGDYIFRPTLYAYRSARQWLLEAYAFMGHRFIRPSLVPDGEGGIDIEWAYKRREVLLSCRARPIQRDYIYYQEGEQYNAKDASSEYLKDRLSWLIQA